MGYSALYLHVPFCRSKCLYCDFDSRACGASRTELDAYLDLLIAQVRARGRAGDLSGVRTAYIGGGTPTLAGTRIAEVVEAVREFCGPVELTCEANPESFTDAVASALADAGATRISLGVQSLVPGELQAIGRVHTADEALAAVERAERFGFSASCDLMCGLPGQTLGSWRRSVEGVLSLAQGPDHVSVYPLQLEEGTPLERLERAGAVDVPDGDFQAECMELAAELLSAAGFSRYEVASYARPGCACRHNIAYWTGSSYLGIGRSAAGMEDLGDAGRVRTRQLDDAGERVEREVLSAREAAAEDLMLACRMVRGIAPELLERAGRHIPAAEVRAACERAVRVGLARWERGRLVPTRLGWLEGNELYGIFWDLA